MSSISYNPLFSGKQKKVEASAVPAGGAVAIPQVGSIGDTKDVFVSTELPAGLVQLLQHVQNTKTAELTPDEIIIPALDVVPDLHMARPGYYLYGDFQILSGRQVHTDTYVENLKRLNQLSIMSAPQLVQYIQFPGGDSLVITKVKDCDVRKVVPYAQFGRPISRENRDLFYDDMARLLDHGLFNPVMNKPGYWDVNPATDQIVLNHWSELMPLPADLDKAKILDDIKTHLDSFY